MARRGPIILAVFLLALLPGICRGDGKVFPFINHHADIPEQQALIVWRDGVRAELAKAQADLPPEEDAPGSFTLSRSEAGFEIRTFGPSGLEYRLEVPFEPEPAPRDR